jgi:putative peptidoglycan lipid II flippase
VSKSLYKKVGIATLIITASIFLSRVTGLLREMALAYIGGATGDVDAYQIAFVIPEILNHIGAAGFLSVTFIPIFTEYLVKKDEAEGWRIFSLICNVFGAITLLFVVVSFIFAKDFIGLIVPGVHDPAILAKAVRMTRIIIPAQFFFFTGSLFMAVQYTKEKFAIPALAPVVYNVIIIACGIILHPWLGIEGFSWGVLVGAFAGQFLIQYWGAKKSGMQYHTVFDFYNPQLLRYVKLTLPLIFGLTMTFSTEIFFRIFGSYLPQGSIASLNYGLRITLMLVALFGQAVGTASYPFLARMAKERQFDQMNNLINSTLRYLALVIPVSALLIVIRHEVVMILFQRGRFDATATAVTSQVLGFLLAGAFFIAAQNVVVRGYFAMEDTLFPAIFSTFAVAVSVPIYYYGMQAFGINGIAFAVSASVALQITILYVIWNRRTKNSGSRDVYLFIGRMTFLSIAIGLFLELFKKYILSALDVATFTGSLASSLINGCLFIIIFLAAGRMMKIKEIVDLQNKVTAKLRGTQNSEE